MARIEEAEQGVRDLEEMNQKTMAAGLASGLGVSSLPDIMANAARKLTNDEKAKILPPEGYLFVLGPCVWRVTYRNLGKLRFTATLTGVVQAPPETAEKQEPNDERRESDDEADSVSQ